MESLNVLFVEDDPDVREIVKMALCLEPGLEVTALANGKEALREAERKGRTFDLALLDFRLPDMTGLDLHRRLLWQPGLSQLRTILLTGSVLDLLDQPARVPGLIGILAKPFDPLKLPEDIRRLIAADDNFDPRTFKDTFRRQQRALFHRAALR